MEVGGSMFAKCKDPTIHGRPPSSQVLINTESTKSVQSWCFLWEDSRLPRQSNKYHPPYVLLDLLVLDILVIVRALHGNPVLAPRIPSGVLGIQ